MAGDQERGGVADRGAFSMRSMALLLVLAFFGGLAAMAWINSRWDGLWWGKDRTAGREIVTDSRGPPLPSGPVRKSTVLANDHVQAITARVAELEGRLAQITVQAHAAAGNAARAEGLLIAFAARRALDMGQTLGYIEGQLRLRFGQAQPRAVATIISAGREPVTLQDLQAGLEEIGPDLTIRGRSENWWADMKREVGELVVFRQAGSPSPLPQRRLERAKRLIEEGRVDAALAEVARLPGRTAGAKWMEQARRYVEARRALDLIETAAILEPGQSRPVEENVAE